ncbi:MAG TPA: hypothetical protein VF607_16195, partial [Verrucomicrobiae bacterium]
ANETYLFLGAANNPATRAEYTMTGGLLDMNGKTLGLALGVNVLITGVVNQVSGVITNVGQIFLDSFFSTGYSILNLTGGSLYLQSGGITVQNGGNYEINLGGATLAAQASWSSGLNMKLTGINGATTFNPAGNNITLSGSLSGPGGLVVNGGGTLELAGANSYAGDTTVGTGSTLKLDVAGSTSAAMRVANGAFLGLNYLGTYTVGNFYTNGVALPNGTYTAANLPAFISGTGSLQVTGALPSNPVPVGFSVTGSALTLSWPANYQGWILQQQTNAGTLGLGTNWVDVAGSANVTTLTLPINRATPAAFFRLRYPTP